MSPKGLVPAILASIPLQLGLASGQQIAEIGYAVVLLSIFICSILVIVVSKDPFIFNKILRRNKKDKANNDESVSDEGLQLNEVGVSEKESTDEDTEATISIKKKYKDEFDD